MTVKAISHSYWRTIKNGSRTYESIIESPKAAISDRAPEIKYLAKRDVADGIITEEEYEAFIGEVYEA